MNGEVVKVEKTGDMNVFLVKPSLSLENDSEEIYGTQQARFQYDGFLPIREGDIVSIGPKMKLGGRGKRYLLKEKPLVYIPTEEEDLKRFFKMALVQGRKDLKFKPRYPRDIGDRIYREMLAKMGSHQKIIDLLNQAGVEFFTSVNDRDKFAIYWWWKKNVMKRQLYLIGLYNKEIRESGLREDILFQKIRENPMKVASLSLERVFEINTLFRRKTEEKDVKCGGIYRKLDEFRKKGWFYVPEKIMKKIYPSLKELYSYLIEEYGVVVEDKRIYSYESYQIEDGISKRVAELIKLDREGEKIRAKLPTPKKKTFKVYSDLTLTKEQEEALESALRNYISIITGGAGCGKTTLLREIVKNLDGRGRKVLLTSFTGKAVMRIKEVLDDKHFDERCMTLSKIITRREGYQKIPQFDTLIIDEASMISTVLFNKFLSLFHTPFKIIFIGDCNQLEPIDSGALLKELIRSETIETHYLTINKRSQSSLIIKNASRLIDKDRDFRKPLKFKKGDGFYVIDEEVDFIKKIVKGLWKSEIDDNRVTILSPVNKYIPRLVEFHQKTYLKGKIKMKYGEKIYYYGDRMMQKTNFYSDELEVMNGEEGYITEMTEEYMEITYRKDKIVSYDWLPKPKRSPTVDDGNEPLTNNSLINSFAKTIHKSQGSEYDYVIIFLPSESVNFVTINMLYTAITRAREKVWIVGEKSTIDRITTQRLAKRYETLAYRLVNEVG
jgi:DNA replication protein DnaC